MYGLFSFLSKPNQLLRAKGIFALGHTSIVSFPKCFIYTDAAIFFWKGNQPYCNQGFKEKSFYPLGNGLNLKYRVKIPAEQKTGVGANGEYFFYDKN